jgi:Mg2+-importing ATPase
MTAPVQNKVITTADIVHKPLQDIIEILNCGTTGLSTSNIAVREAKYRINIVKEEVKNDIIKQFLSGFKSPLTFILLIVAGVSYGTGETLNALIISVMIILSVGMNFFQEYKAGNAA